MKRRHEIDLTEGKMPGKIIAFALPVIFSGFFQTLFNVVDMMVVGKFVGDQALAAVGSTNSLINLMTQLFIGLSTGATIMISRYFGARDNERMSKSSHTAIMLGIVGGVFLAVFGFVFARMFLEAMGSPGDVIDLATTYIRIYFVGMPAVMLYNFSSSVMRAYGDNQRSLYFLMLSGVLNIVLNLVFVLVFHMSVEGVAIATVASQGVAAVLNLVCLMKVDNGCRISLKKLKIWKDELLHILRFGIPTGIQSSVFSLSNVFIQSAINSFGSTAMAAHGAVTYLGNVLGNVSNGFANAATTVCSQNFGAGKKKRILRGWLICLGYVVAIEAVLGIVSLFVSSYFMRIFTDNAETVEIGVRVAKMYIPFWFIGGAMSSTSSAMRGMGVAVSPMVVTILGTCVLRIIWIYTIFAQFHILEVLYACYPVTWFITGAAQMVMLLHRYKHLSFPVVETQG
ncbi:MAG: MATE family efflux transporter [Clostridia bacterium]|nr:MATE family efflux transporter [Clostridia bacterium]